MKKDYEESSGNVFADLGFKDSEQELLKTKLTLQIYRLLKTSKLAQAEAAKSLGTTQPQISALIRCGERSRVRFLSTRCGTCFKTA